jgi:hypothetical protein
VATPRGWQEAASEEEEEEEEVEDGKGRDDGLCDGGSFHFPNHPRPPVFLPSANVV